MFAVGRGFPRRQSADQDPGFMSPDPLGVDDHVRRRFDVFDGEVGSATVENDLLYRGILRKKEPEQDPVTVSVKVTW